MTALFPALLVPLVTDVLPVSPNDASASSKWLPLVHRLSWNAPLIRLSAHLRDGWFRSLHQYSKRQSSNLARYAGGQALYLNDIASGGSRWCDGKSAIRWGFPTNFSLPVCHLNQSCSCLHDSFFPNRWWQINAPSWHQYLRDLNAARSQCAPDFHDLLHHEYLLPSAVFSRSFAQRFAQSLLMARLGAGGRW